MEREPAGLADVGFEQADLALVVRVSEFDFGRRQVAGLGARDHGFRERVSRPVKMGFSRTTR